MVGDHRHVGSALEDFDEEDGSREEVYGAAPKRVLAWQLEQERAGTATTKSSMAAAMGTSRAQLDRVLDPDNVTVSIETMDKAARAGKASEDRARRPLTPFGRPAASSSTAYRYMKRDETLGPRRLMRRGNRGAFGLRQSQREVCGRAYGFLSVLRRP